MKPARVWPLLAPAALGLAALAGGGCATPGPTHVYTAGRAHPETIRDTGPQATAEVPAFTTAEEGLTGLAYDPYTDHLFLRLAPGHRIRVVDRPDRSIKREFTIPALAEAGGGDLAVRPRDGRIFFVCGAERFVVETDRFGEFVRRLTLDGLQAGVAGLAYDAVRHRLLVATTGTPAELRFHGLDGRLLQSADLGSARVKSLAYDAASREIHATVDGEPGIVVFNEEGRRLRHVPSGDPVDFLDLGQRSFVRVF